MDRKEYEKLIRQLSNEGGVPPEIAIGTFGRESSGDPNIGYHYQGDPNKTAYGPFGITKPYAEDFGQGADWKDPVGGLYTYLRGMKSHYKRFGNWPQAVEAHFLGPGNVGNEAYRKEHPAEWDSVRAVLGGIGSEPGPASRLGASPASLYPSGFGSEMMQAAADRTRVAGEAFMGAQRGYESAVNQPFSLPRQELNPPREGIAVGVPSLLANLATAISGNPLYQQVQQGRFATEDEERRQATQENLQLSRQEMMQKRSEHLQMMHDKLQLAAQRLEADQKYEQAFQLQGEMAKVQEKMQRIEGDQAKERAEIAAGATTDAAYIRLQGVLAKQGFQLMKDEQGEWQVTQTGEAQSQITLKRNDRMERVQGWGKLATETKDPKKAEFAKLQMAMAIATPDDNDKNWNGLMARSTRELEQLGIPAGEIELLLHAAAFENAGKVPGAAEEYKRIQDALNTEKKGKEVPKPAAVKAAPKGGEDTWDRVVKGFMGAFEAPNEAEYNARKQAVGRALTGVAGGVVQGAREFMGNTPVQVAEGTVKSAQHEVDVMKRVMERFPVPEATSQLAAAYKKLEKAKKDLETIQNEGKSPAKK